ncbi:MAG: DUF6261 family protein, partial [Alistipes sp.]|nr:DUF6261 family protein [Alistipes sp.]
MKISGIRLPNLQNAEHFQFHTDALALMTDATPAALKITAQYDLYLAAFRTEDAIMRQILRSARTAEIAEADRARDEIFRGMANLNKAMLTHFDDARRAAAGRIQIVFDTYGNVAAEALAKESADIHNLLQELAGAQHAADCEALGLVGWIAELDRRNVAVQELMLDRYEEQPVTDG